MFRFPASNETIALLLLKTFSSILLYNYTYTAYQFCSFYWRFHHLVYLANSMEAHADFVINVFIQFFWVEISRLITHTNFHKTSKYTRWRSFLEKLSCALKQVFETGPRRIELEPQSTQRFISIPGTFNEDCHYCRWFISDFMDITNISLLKICFYNSTLNIFGLEYAESHKLYANRV